jgi:predicted membrane protein
LRLNFNLPKTLWITWVSLLLGMIILGLTSEMWGFNSKIDSFSQMLSIGILGSIFSFFTYGIIVWPPTLLLMLIFELAFSKKELKHVDIKRLLQIEFLIVSIPFAIWAITEDYLYWYYFIVVLGISQILRYRYLTKVE